MPRARTRSLGPLVLLVALLVGCSPAAPTEPRGASGPSRAAAPAARDDLTLGMGAGLLTLNPHLEANNQLTSMLAHMSETLLTMGPDLRLVGKLAQSWTAADPQTWEFKLRPNVKFHDGSPFTAQVAKFNVDWVLDPANKVTLQRGYISDVVETEAVNELTLRIKTRAPSGTLPSRIQRLAMNSRRALEELGPAKFALAPVGSGPYRFVEFVRDDHLSVERWDGYWGAKPAIRGITFRFIPEDATRVAALQAASLDLAVNIPPDVAEQFARDPAYRVERVHTLRNQFVRISAKNPPFDNLKVRQALNHAIDREAIVKNVLRGNATITPAFCSPELTFGCPSDLAPYPYDPNRARQLLAEAGYPNGFETTLWNSQGRYLASVDIGQAILGYLDKVGIKAKLELREWGVFQTMVAQEQVPTLAYFGYGNQFADVDGPFGQFHSAFRPAYWSTPETDARIEAQRAEFDPAKRQRLAEAIVRDIYAQAPWLFLWDIHDVHVARASLLWTARADEQILMAEASWK